MDAAERPRHLGIAADAGGTGNPVTVVSSRLPGGTVAGSAGQVAQDAQRCRQARNRIVTFIAIVPGGLPVT